MGRGFGPSLGWNRLQAPAARNARRARQFRAEHRANGGRLLYAATSPQLRPGPPLPRRCDELRARQGPQGRHRRVLSRGDILRTAVRHQQINRAVAADGRVGRLRLHELSAVERGLPETVRPRPLRRRRFHALHSRRPRDAQGRLRGDLGAHQRDAPSNIRRRATRSRSSFIPTASDGSRRATPASS